MSHIQVAFLLKEHNDLERDQDEEMRRWIALKKRLQEPEEENARLRIEANCLREMIF